jgi:hypothetical protein
MEGANGLVNATKILTEERLRLNGGEDELLTAENEEVSFRGRT